MVPHQHAVDWRPGKWQADIDYIGTEVGGVVAVAYDLYSNRDPLRTWGAVGAVLPDVVDAAIVILHKGDVALPPHNGWPGYAPYKFTFNKDQTILGTVLLVSICVKF
jgi:hypothetical protein